MREFKIIDMLTFQKILDPFQRVPLWNRHFLFRGQSNANWSLRPSLMRLLSPELEKPQIERLELMAKEHFAARVRNYLDDSLLPNGPKDTTSAWWPLMQHYQAPTRLLDWTRSPYVAAYFAVRSWEDGAPGCIWIVDFDSINYVSQNVRLGKTSNPVDPTTMTEAELPALVTFFESPLLTDRMAAQQSWHSTCSNPALDHDVVISEMLEGEQTGVFWKLVIKGELKPEILHALYNMNINALTLFPGIEGLGHSIQEQMEEQVRFEATLLASTSNGREGPREYAMPNDLRRDALKSAAEFNSEMAHAYYSLDLTRLPSFKMGIRLEDNESDGQDSTFDNVEKDDSSSNEDSDAAIV